MRPTLIITLLFTLTFWSCSVIKNPKSSNFHRVKYHAHLKKNKKEQKVFVNTVESFIEEEKSIPNNSDDKLSSSKTVVATKGDLFTVTNVTSEATLETQLKVEKSVISQQLNAILNEAKQFKAEKEKAFVLTHDWWEEDPEDWPWGEIVLVVIAILVIAILIVILIELVGAIIGSLLGLIFLLALAYFLYQYWV